MHVAICNVGLGNLRSVERALLHAAQAADPGQPSVTVAIESDPDTIRRADKIVMPGQGAFRDCAQALGNGLGDVVRERIAAGVPYLGICLGLQVLFGESEEAPGCAGLGVFSGRVARLEGGVDPLSGAPLKIPHVGWNEVEPGPAQGLFSRARAGARDAAPPPHFYFVHSFVVVPDDASIVAGVTRYGAPFVSAVAKDNVFACQFHPEKSQQLGIDLLTRFLMV